MNPNSKTQQAKRLYRQLEADGELPSLWFSGLLKDTIWVTRNSRAYYVHELSTEHLRNIIANCKVLNQEIPTIVSKEYSNRLDFIGANKVAIHNLELGEPEVKYCRVARNRLHKWWLEKVCKQKVLGTRKELTSKATFNIDFNKSVPKRIDHER